MDTSRMRAELITLDQVVEHVSRLLLTHDRALSRDAPHRRRASRIGQTQKLIQRQAEMLEIESRMHRDGIATIAGVDEAGRGPLAGPVVAAAVILPKSATKGDGDHDREGPAFDSLLGLDDSKKLNSQQRQQLFVEVMQVAQAVGVGISTSSEIDALNILRATHLAMRRAVSALAVAPERALVDGNTDPRLGLPTECIVKGDARALCIAAASVVAKVVRDTIMERLDETYPQYGFALHKGYPTKDHYEALAVNGPCPIHRRSFRLGIERE